MKVFLAMEDELATTCYYMCDQLTNLMSKLCARTGISHWRP